MKKWMNCVVVTFLFLVIAIDVRGIPNQFGGTTFINPASMRLEDFAAQEKIWQPGAELKGNWEMWKDEAVTDPNIELLHLAMPAIVFGVAASEVTVQRRDETILQFQVVFEPNNRVKEFDKLHRIVRTNASVWSGSDAEASTMNHGASIYTFESLPEEKRLVMVVRPRG